MRIVSIPVVSGTNPVTAVGSPLKDALTISVVSVPVAVAVWAELQAAEEMAEVAKAFVPEAMVAGMVDDVEGNVIVVESVPTRVRVLEAVSVLPLATAKVPAEKIALPVPSSSVRAAARLADDGVPRKVATPVASPEMPVEIAIFPPPAAFEWSWVALAKLAMVGVTMI